MLSTLLMQWLASFCMSIRLGSAPCVRCGSDAFAENHLRSSPPISYAASSRGESRSKPLAISMPKRSRASARTLVGRRKMGRSSMPLLRALKSGRFWFASGAGSSIACWCSMTDLNIATSGTKAFPKWRVRSRTRIGQARGFLGLSSNRFVRFTRTIPRHDGKPDHS